MWRVSQNNYLRNLPYYYLIYDHHHLCGIYITYLSSFLLDLYAPEVDNNLYGYFMISSSKLLHLDESMKIERDDLLKILS